jgi:SRF-type transcription factor (DNA-binding and dimerisation domain)
MAEKEASSSSTAASSTAKKPVRKHTGRRRIPIEYIKDKSRRQITFSKRKAGIMKKVCHATKKKTDKKKERKKERKSN